MKLAVVGVGNAGSRIVNRILDAEKASGRNLCNGNTLLINSTTPSFDTTEHVPQERRLTIGDVHWEVDGADIAGDPDVGAEVAREERNEIIRAFDSIEFHQIDGVLVVAGLAGGTGGGVGSVVIDQLKSICDEPIYAVCVLPSELEGQRPALTAARSLQSFVGRADNVIAFDNDAWRSDDPRDVMSRDVPVEDDAHDEEDASAEEDVPAEGDASAEEDAPAEADAAVDETSAEEDVFDEGYARVNAAFAERIVTLFAAGAFDGTSAPENRLDPSDIIRTLDTGGISSIGYASIDLPRNGGIGAWLRSLRVRLPWTADDETVDEDESTDAAKINNLVRQAARSKLTLPCEVSSADRALIVLSGPSRTLSRKGFESGRYWLEREADIVDVMAGDDPHDRSTALTAVVLFSNVTEVPRIDTMQETAVGQTQPVSTEEWEFGTANPS